MGDLELKCSLCCGKTFNSKVSLAAHLATVLASLTCPVCNNKWSSIAHLIEHLNLDDCEPEYGTVQTIQESHEYVIENPLPESSSYDNDDTETITTKMTIKDKLEFEENFVDEKNISDGTIGTSVNNEMLVEILSKDQSRACLQTQGLKLVNDDGDMERFVVLTDEQGTPVNLNSALVTKQNSDGTISLQTLNEMKLESDTETVIAPSENETEDNQEELYSCNTCGVSFSSVLDHIQNYHNDQEVVVEEPLEDDEGDMSVAYGTLEAEDQLGEKLEVPRRVITDNGDIVDAAEVETIVPDGAILLNESERVEKPPRQQGRRYVQIEKFCDSMVKNISPDKKSENGGTHKVVVKEVMHNGSQMKTYYCMSCNIYVSNLDDFKNHPCKMLKYPCPHCPVAYENSKSLCAHMRVHKSKIEETVPQSVDYFKCEICNTVFQTNKSLKLHKRMHDPVKSRPIEPPIETPEGNEGSTGRYLCTVCDRLIPVDYKAIHQESHTADDQLNCGICNKKFLSNKYLEMHMSVHNQDKVPVNKTDKTLPYSCLYCTRRFARPHEKVKHERIHTGEKPHSCEICGKSFRVSYCLTLHMRTHTGARPYACPLCGKRFKAHSVYNHHLLTHSEVRRYKCPYCPKAFKTSVQLAGHKNSHTKPFSCEHCNRPFASLYAVRVHTETHARQNNLKFSCSLCGASYARAFALKDHLKQVHKQDVDSADISAANLSKDNVWVIDEGVKNHMVQEGELQASENKELSHELTESTSTQSRLAKDDWPMDEGAEQTGDELQEVELQTLDSKDLTQITELEMTTDQL